MKKIWIAGTLIFLLTLFLPSIKVLSISVRTDLSEKVYSRRAQKNGWSIGYTHSVNKGRVYDYYRATKDGCLELYKTEFVSYGAGIPEAVETPGAVFSVEQDFYSISSMERKLKTLVMAVGVVAEHSIVIDGNELFLKNLYAPMTSLVFQIKKTSLFDYIITKKIP